MWIAILVIIVVVGGYIVMVYNSLIAMIEAVKNNEKQIDIQLDRRYKVFESLINVVKKYMDYEKSTLKEVISLRTQAQSAKQSGDHAARMGAENKISGILSGLNVVFEQKQAYNDSIEQYNAKKKSFFPSWVVALFSAKLNFNFPYWQLDKDKVKDREDYTVSL